MDPNQERGTQASLVASEERPRRSGGQGTEDVSEAADGTASSEALIERWITPDPVKPGYANARVRDYSVAVWALANYLNAGDTIEAVAAGYALPPEAVQAARAYDGRHRAELDAKLRLLLAE